MVRRKNWGYMQHGIVVWLDGPPELLARRACQDESAVRPLLQDSSEQTVSAHICLLAMRVQWYLEKPLISLIESNWKEDQL